MQGGLIELFEGLKNDFGSLSVEEFKKAYDFNRFSFFSVTARIPSLSLVWGEFNTYTNTIVNDKLPLSLREDGLARFQSRLDEVIVQLRSGAITTPKRRISDKVIVSISDAKVKQICIEINNLPDYNVLSLAQNIGEGLKWTLWYKAKQIGTTLKEQVGLGQLLDEAITKPYFSSNVAKRFLSDFKSNFMKTGYDMVRHSESYIPDIDLLNPQLHGLEVIIKETFDP